ncbi:MAG: GFA family protein [Granulosicoccus sp.]
MSTGSCLCGTVKFRIHGEATGMSHCHCSMCRRFHGTAFATYFNVEGMSILAGEDEIDTYESSPGFTRTFCRHCGSPLPEKSGQQDGYFISAGLMDEDPQIRPECHIFTESKADWYNITDTLPQHQHYGDNDLSRVVDVSERTTTKDWVSGGCLCGDVTFEYTGAPSMMMNCHCSRCRKVKGAAHASNLFVPGDNFRWNTGESNITGYAHAEAKFFGNNFCKTCGSSVPRPRPDGSVFNIPAGSLNQSPGLEPKGHIFVASKAPWFEISDDKPQWDEMPT